METIQMTKKAQKRVKIMELLLAGLIGVSTAAERLEVSKRQVYRIKADYLTEGDGKLNHGSIGKPGNHSKGFDFRETVLNIYRERYEGFGPTFASEMLKEEFGIEIHRETLRLWLKKAGLWNAKRKSVYRKRRKRRACFGELLQMDGSIHDWFGNGQEVCLQNCIDDATGKTFGFFATGETTEVALKVLYYWIRKYGIPEAIYTDYKSVYRTGREPTLEEQIAGLEPMTEFGRVCHKLGIGLIYASSPQAKGRVERSNGILQDRLLKTMKLKGICNIESANVFLMNEFWDKYNLKVEKDAESGVDAHVPLLPSQVLDRIVCFEWTRKLSRDFVIQWENRCFQVLRENETSIRPGMKVTVQKWLDGSVHLWYNDSRLAVKEIPPVTARQMERVG
jgi:transposase